MLEELTKNEDAKQEYKPIALTLDGETRLTIIINENSPITREIIVNDSGYDLTSSKYEQKLPPELVGLIKEIQLIRQRR